MNSSRAAAARTRSTESLTGRRLRRRSERGRSLISLASGNGAFGDMPFSIQMQFFYDTCAVITLERFDKFTGHAKRSRSWLQAHQVVEPVENARLSSVQAAHLAMARGTRAAGKEAHRYRGLDCGQELHRLQDPPFAGLGGFAPAA